MTRLTFLGALMIGVTACVVRSGPPPDGRGPGGPGPGPGTGGPPASGPAYVAPAIGPDTFIVPSITTAYSYEDAYDKLRSLGVTGDVVFLPAPEHTSSVEMRVYGIDGVGRTQSTREPVLIAVIGANPTEVMPMLPLVGMPVRDAIIKLVTSKYYGFTVRHVLASASCAKGVVCAQVPGPGESTRIGDVRKMIIVAVQ
ncbi:MAG: hypothetical protein IT370_10915 [Deltaproteobacteria bacterium]|nr:hypothetical protein [Deltaproteobacteria bacterium]